MLDVALYLTELSILDYFFVLRKPSLVALAAIQNAMVVVTGRGFVMNPIVPNDDDHVRSCCDRLWVLHTNAQQAPHDDGGAMQGGVVRDMSPVSVIE